MRLASTLRTPPNLESEQLTAYNVSGADDPAHRAHARCLFMVEKGKIGYPMMNFRWNESAPNVLANVEMMTEPVLVNGRLVPAMKVRDFNVSSQPARKRR